jgi:hypothetical protein
VDSYRQEELYNKDLRLFRFADTVEVVGDGQEQAELLFYARLPESLRKRAMEKLNQLKVAK